MKQIFIITGRTGAGKSTLCKKLQEYFDIPLLSFANMGKEFATKCGYHRIRECHLAMELGEFIEKLSTHTLKTISEQINICNIIIIDGLYITKVLQELKLKYDCKIIYLKVDSKIRYERVSNRLNIPFYQAEEEMKIKEKLKEDVGIDDFIKQANLTVDGSKLIDEVFEFTKKYIKDEINSKVNEKE